jgi:hypothetical protein
MGCNHRSMLDIVMAWSEKRIYSECARKTMSVATSVKRYMSSFAPDAGQRRILSGSSPTFSSSFVTSCRFWLAVNLIWATLVVAACVTVAMRLRIDKSVALIAFVILVSASYAFRGIWKSKLSVKTFLILVLAVVSTGFLLWPCLTKGAFVSVTGDTFLYTAHGQYLTDHHRGFEYGLPPIDQYATGMSESRFGTASVLGFLSVLFHSSTAAALPIYVFIVLVNIFSGFVLLSRRFGCNRLFSLATGLYAVIGGWTPNALSVGGLDNLLFLSLFPFLVVRLELYRFGYKSWSTSLGVAMLASSAFYSYPEGLAIAGVIFLPFFCESLWRGMYRRGKTWRCYLVSAGLVLVLISPYIQVFFASLFERINIGMARVAAGLFPGLFSPRFLPAMFAFGQEYAGTISPPHDVVLPITMLAFIVLGSAIWIRRRKSLILAFAILIGMAIWQGPLLQYDYGLYKILFIGSLIWIPSLFRGGTTLANFLPRPTRPFAVTLGAIIFFSGALAQRMEQQEKIPFRQVIPVKCYSDLANLRHKVGDLPVLLICEKAFAQEYNDFDQQWAVYFLRHVNLKVPEYFGYLKDGGRLMPRAKSTSQPAAFVLVNKRIEGAVWNNQRFSLFELPMRAEVVDVQAPNGLEHVNGKPFVWLGNNATRFLIVSKIAQTATFSAEECLSGPARSEDKTRHIRISMGGNAWQADVSGALSIEVPLKPGLNFLAIACQDSSTVSEQANGNSRALPLGLWDYRISE